MLTRLSVHHSDEIFQALTNNVTCVFGPSRIHLREATLYDNSIPLPNQLECL